MPNSETSLKGEPRAPDWPKIVMSAARLTNSAAIVTAAHWSERFRGREVLEEVVRGPARVAPPTVPARLEMRELWSGHGPPALVGGREGYAAVVVRW